MRIFDYAVVTHNEQVYFNNWIEWKEIILPTKPTWFRTIIQGMLAFFGHCGKCTALGGCYFVERNMPEQPQHERCHCGKFSISNDRAYSDIQANCPIEKFTEYVFTDDKKSKGKKSIFESMGYTKENSYQLKNLFEYQAREQYLKGLYELDLLDEYGQRINIEMNLNGHLFISGWILEPKGKMRNATPFGGWIQ